MSRILLASSPEKGHTNPLSGLALALRAAGHHVGWLAVPEASPQLRRLGIEVLELGGQGPGLVTGGEALARLVRDREALRAWIRGLLLDAVPAQLGPARAALERFAPDVVATDGMLYAVVIAAEELGVPWAGISSALTLLEPPGLDFDLIRNVRALGADRAALFAAHGLHPAFRTCECLSPRLNVVFATEALVGEDAAVPGATWLVGPSLPAGLRGDEPDFPWDRLSPAKPLVYVSFGSQISWQPELFRSVAEAAAPLGVTLVLSAGELCASGFCASLPGDVVAVPYAPQLALLPRAAAFVSHGGANSVMEALAHGVPLLLLPICNDQPVQAHFLGRAGAGLTIDPSQATPERLRAALQRLLSDGPERAAARRVQASYRSRDGAAEAARRVAALQAGSRSTA
jgi:MGT family glycosyltransferase